MRSLPFVLVAAFLALLACSSPSAPALLVLRYDAGNDATADGPVDGRSGINPDGAPDASYLGGPCVDDAQCDDHIACTYDSCDKAITRCLNVPDASQCQDGVYCNGTEQCVPGLGCERGAVVSCDNGDECKTAICVEKTKLCEYVPRDVDQDGDPDAHCVPKHDCNDLDPAVSSLHAEVCANGVDDNCNGLIDENPCVVPQGNTCAGAVKLGGAGTYSMSTVGCNDTFSTSCSVSMPTAAQTVVGTVVVPAGGNVDLEVWVTASVDVAVAIQATCGVATSELACGSGPSATSVRARAYGVSPGTYFAVVTTQSPTPSVTVQVALLSPTPPPANVDCSSAAPVTPGMPLTVAIVDPLPTDLPTTCPGTTGQLTYSFTLIQPRDVRVYGATVRGSGSPIIGLRSPHCTDLADELACETAGGAALYEQSLPAGMYFVTLAATSPIDANLDVELAPPTTPAPNQTCTAPPVVTANERIDLDLSNHENAIKDGCFPSGPDEAFDLRLANASDVLLIAQIPQSESGGVSLDAPACDALSQLVCSKGNTPVLASKRNVRAGDWRVVLADQLGLRGTLDVLVRDTVAPTIVPAGGASTCAQAVDASKGGFFTGNSSTVMPGLMSGCDAPNQAGEHAQILALNLTQSQRVVLDMEGSAYQTLLEIRQGPSCPGDPINNGCYVGFGSQRSFLDLELTAGTYWIYAAGYNGADGVWDLDVRVLPP